MPNTRVPAAGEAMPVIGRFSRRVLLGAIAAVPATAALATPPKVFPDFGAAPAEHPDAALFALDREMEEARANLAKASKAQDEIYQRCEDLYPPRPAEWEEPKMPDHIQEMVMAMTFGDVARHPEKEPIAYREWHKWRDGEKAAWRAQQEAYLKQVETIEREGGLYIADEAYDARLDEVWQVGRRIFATPASTLEGMAIKLHTSNKLNSLDIVLDDLSEDKAFLSIAADIRRLAAGDVS